MGTMLKHERKGLFTTLILLPVSFCTLQAQPLFSELPSKETGITFQNKLIESPEANIITYEYFYNGGGVAAADFNNDGLIDLYFTSNQQPNKLYINKGNMRFEDITRQAGAGGRRGWKTGVSVADVNGDGLLDIYVCYSGDVDAEYRVNQLYINNGNLIFTDRAKEMGVADSGYTTHAAFFDMDRDGDLDLYVLNHNIKNLRNFDAAFVKKMVDPYAGDRLYENVNGKFTDVSRKAGIISNPLGYGLGLNIADINNDGWPDIYVSNDYVEEDYLYINNKNGTFTESLKSSFGHLSNFSMGVDIADINNDSWPDIFTLDMLPEDNRRQKLLYAPDNYELYNNTLQNGFYHQLMRNMLQVNNGNGTFSEIGQAAGVSNTDWSWAALLADFNNDGKKDLFVTNGYGRDMINRDFIKFYANERLKHLQGKTDSRMFLMLQGIKSTPLHNYIYENTGDLSFKDRSADWGFGELNFSHGAVYADLDNDGDLDLVINKMNQEAGIYKNNTIENKNNGSYLKLQLKTITQNKFAVGAKASLYTQSGTYTLENYPVHGFQSSMQVPLHFTFPDKKIDSIIIRWPDGNTQIQKTNLTVNTQLEIAESKVSPVPSPAPAYTNTIFKAVNRKINYTHKEDVANDFKIQPLMPNMLSYSGPRIAHADINEDQLEDIYVCGPKQQAGAVFLQQADGNFVLSGQPDIEKDAEAEDCGAVFFDADKDGDKDLYVVSGGYAVSENDLSLQDRLYINEKGKFIKKNDGLPVETISGSCVVPMDFDSDGDMDLFIGGRCIPGRYPEPPKSILLVNDGKGKFTDQTSLFALLLSSLGMVTDAIWADINHDNKNELIVCGEWMPVQCFSFIKEKFTDITNTIFDKKLTGWWNRLALADLDKDNDLDLIAGNWGTNSQIQASEKEPATMYYGDFDNNGFIDPLLCYYIQGKSYPMASRDEMTDQMVSLRQRFPTYDSYANAAINDVLTDEQKKKGKELSVNYMQTTWFENVNGKFITRSLPVQAGFSPVYAIYSDDFNHDGNMDILLAGNVEQVRIKIGKIDANYGVLLAGDGKGNFKYVPQTESGLKIKGCVRDMIRIKTKKNDNILMLGLNNEAPLLLTY
jgi:enediyne biosynthesis protein E4